MELQAATNSAPKHESMPTRHSALTRLERLRMARESLAQAESKTGVCASSAGGVWHIEAGNQAIFEALTTLKAGTWIGFLCFPNVGWVRAQQMGIDLDRTLVVPQLEELAPVLTALIDGVDAVVCGHANLSRRQQRNLAGRVRTRGVTLITVDAWPGISRPWKRSTQAPVLTFPTLLHSPGSNRSASTYLPGQERKAV